MDRLPFVGYATSTHGPPSGGVPVDQDRLPFVGYATNGQAPTCGVCHQWTGSHSWGMPPARTAPPPVGFPSIRTGSHLWGMPPMDRLPLVGYATNGQAPIRGVCHHRQTGQAPMLGACHQYRPEYGGFYHPIPHFAILKRSQSQCSGTFSTVSCGSIQLYSSDLLLGALAPTAQYGLYGLPLCGSTTVHRRSAARCPGTFSPVRSPFLAG